MGPDTQDGARYHGERLENITGSRAVRRSPTEQKQSITRCLFCCFFFFFLWDAVIGGRRFSRERGTGSLTSRMREARAFVRAVT